MKKTLFSLALAAIVSFATLAAAELVVRLLIPVRSVGPAVSVYDPVYGSRLRRNFRGVQITPEFTMHISTNSLGFRGPEPVDFPRRAVLYLGDSFTVGYGVDDGQEFPAVVDQLLHASGVTDLAWVNAGRGNTGQGHWLKFLRLEGREFDPLVVVLEVHETDFSDNIRDGLFSLGPDGTLIEHPVPDPGLGRVLQPILNSLPFVANSYLLGLVRQTYFRLTTGTGGGPSGPPPSAAQTASRQAAIDAESRLAYRLLDAVVRECRANGWPVVAIRVAMDPVRDAGVDSVFTALAVPSARIPPPEERPDMYYAVDRHWNVAGNVFAARAVRDLLGSSGAIPIADDTGIR